MKPTLAQAKAFLRPIPREKRRLAYCWATDTGFFGPRKPYLALISPQGHVEYNARFVLGDAAAGLEHGRWYTNAELGRVAGGTALFLRESPGCVEKNIAKWRFEVQT